MNQRNYGLGFGSFIRGDSGHVVEPLFAKAAHAKNWFLEHGGT
jgi:hypothetical protein